METPLKATDQTLLLTDDEVIYSIPIEDLIKYVYKLKR